MASPISLEEKFNAGVTAIQRLPADGTFQPSNITKLICYGLYKQATLGPCQEPRPSALNYISRAKWDAWDRYRSMNKEQAMAAYVDEIRKILQTMPQTNEVLEFMQLVGLSNEVINHPIMNTNGSTHILISAGNDIVLSSSSSSSISSSAVDQFYDDPSDILLPSHDEIVSNDNTQHQSINTTTRLHHYPHLFGGQDGTNVSLGHSIRGGNSHSNVSSTRSPSFRHHNSSNGARYLISPGASGNDNGRYPNNNYNKETQRAILTALTKLQRDINNILKRLNQLETSAHSLQQRELIMSSESNSLSRWLPLSGFRQGAIAFILLWPFFIFALIRLFLHARIIIRFRRARL